MHCSYKSLTRFAELSFVSFHANALSIFAVSMAIAIWDLALFISDIAFFSFPPRLALAFTVDIIPLATA